MQSRTTVAVFIASLLGICFLWQCHLFQRNSSITFDETFYLNCALQTVHDGKLDGRISESGVGSIPIQLTTIPAALTAPRQNRYDEWTGFVGDPEINLIARRLNVLIVGLPMLAIVFFWCFRRHGLLAASTAGSLIAFSPNWIAHASIATMDSCFALFSLISLATIVSWFENPTRRRFLAVSVMTGLTIGTKYSGVFLFPLVGLLLLYQRFKIVEGPLGKRLFKTIFQATWRLCIVISIALTCLWASDWFISPGPLKTVSLEETPPDSPWIKLFGNGPNARKFMDYSHRKLNRPSVLAAIIARWLHNQKGHPAYLMGEVSQYGWRWYFPVTWFLKSTIPELILSAMVIVFAATQFLKPHKESHTVRLIWYLALLVLWTLFCLAKVNLGYRYLLPALPLTILLGIDFLWSTLPRSPRALMLICCLLVAGEITAAFSISPYYLSYFTPLIGGAEEGHRYLSDSNIDWGQDLPSLKEELDKRGDERLLLEYFGTADPAAYNIEADQFALTKQADFPKYDVFAVSVTRWQGTYHDSDPFRELRKLTPLARAGYSIYLYDLKEADVLDALYNAWEKYPKEARQEVRRRTRLKVKNKKSD